MTVGRVSLGTLLAALLVVWPSVPASAHASAIASWPATGQTVTTSPDRLTIEFDAELSPAVLLTVVDAEGSSLTDGEPVVQGAYLTQALKESEVAGAYTASFHVVSADEHPIIGRVDFVVDPDGDATDNPAGEPPDLGLEEPDDKPGDENSAATKDEGGGSGPVLLLAGFGGVVLLIVVMRVAALRRTHPETAR